MPRKTNIVGLILVEVYNSVFNVTKETNIFKLHLCEDEELLNWGDIICLMKTKKLVISFGSRLWKMNHYDQLLIIQWSGIDIIANHYRKGIKNDRRGTEIYLASVCSSRKVFKILLNLKLVVLKVFMTKSVS